MTAHDAMRRDRILDAIEFWQMEYGHSHSVRNIMERVELASTAAVHYHLSRLERQGLIRRCGCGCQRPSVVA